MSDKLGGKDYEFALLDERLNTLRVEMLEILQRQQEIVQAQAKNAGCSCLFMITDKNELYRSPHTKCKVHAGGRTWQAARAALGRE
jgi:hypothetical protein